MHAAIAFSKCRPSTRRDMERKNCPNVSLEISGYGTANGAQTRYRWGCASRSRRSRRGAPCRIRLSDGLVPLLGALSGRTDFTFGQFGENFTVDGLPDDEVCIGDRYRIGDAIFEVTQPRVTCYRVGIRMNEPRMPALLVAHHRPGFYFRVLQEGEVGAGDDIIKIADGPERMSVAEVDALLYLPGASNEQLQRALRIPALSDGWQSSFQAMLQADSSSKIAVGNPGLAVEEAPAWPGFRQM